MAHRYFRTKAQAKRALGKVKRATEVLPDICAGMGRDYQGWMVSTGLSQAQLDDILSKPMPRRKRQ